jgi:hypothetical protein
LLASQENPLGLPVAQIEVGLDGSEEIDVEMQMANIRHCTQTPSVDGRRVWHISTIPRMDATISDMSF